MLVTFYDFVKHFSKDGSFVSKLKGFKFIKLGFYKSSRYMTLWFLRQIKFINTMIPSMVVVLQK